MNLKGVILFVALAALLVAYAVVLQLTGQHADAERFVEWAGGGFASLLACAWFFEVFKED